MPQSWPERRLAVGFGLAFFRGKPTASRRSSHAVPAKTEALRGTSVPAGLAQPKVLSCRHVQAPHPFASHPTLAGESRLQCGNEIRAAMLALLLPKPLGGQKH